MVSYLLDRGHGCGECMFRLLSLPLHYVYTSLLLFVIFLSVVPRYAKLRGLLRKLYALPFFLFLVFEVLHPNPILLQHLVSCFFYLCLSFFLFFSSLSLSSFRELVNLRREMNTQEIGSTIKCMDMA